MNSITHEQYPGTVVIAEESTSWPQVTRPTWTGGLGFSMKWNMGWMHDMLSYMEQDPVHRMHHHDNLNFWYASTHFLRILYCLFHMMKWYMVKVRC